jgi:hypothetical protein
MDEVVLQAPPEPDQEQELDRLRCELAICSALQPLDARLLEVLREKAACLDARAQCGEQQQQLAAQRVRAAVAESGGTAARQRR